MYRWGISPVIATVILVAVAVAISIAVAGWLMGLWGTFGAVEQLQIMPDSNITVNTNSATLYLHVKNTGTKSAVITKVEIAGVGTGAIVSTISGTTTGSAQSSVTISQGGDVTIVATIDKTITPGASYLIKVYTSSGAVYQGYVVAG